MGVLVVGGRLLVIRGFIFPDLALGCIVDVGKIGIQA